MLYIHTSNQLEQLTQRLAAAINAQPLKQVFATETIVVQNAGMGRYLSMQIADIAGISANMEYLFPAEFMWRLLRLVSSDVSKESPCAPNTLRFFIMTELSNNFADYPELHNYILQKPDAELEESITDEIATWELSCVLAQVFDQYLYYRSDWIREWEEDSSKAKTIHEKNWQARLWKKCVKDNELTHWLTLQDQFNSDFTDNDKSNIDLSEVLPERIIFFSMTALSPGYIDILGELAKKIDVHLYQMNPCENVYWGDIQSEKSQARLSPEAQEVSEVGNALLASLGKQGRDFIYQLLESPEANSIPDQSHSNDQFNENSTPKTVLQQLQQDIFTLAKAHDKSLKNYNASDDNSFKLNACHTTMREVEVLHDQLLNSLENDPTLSPSDIIVMMPNVDDYAPYIETIFASNSVKLPFSIADRNPLQVLTLIEVLLKTLMLSETRFDVESVFEILDYEAVRNQFNLDESEVSECRELARATNIRWGISAKTRTDNQLPETEEHTWKYALDRLLLGYTMGEHPEGEQLFDSDRLLALLPFNDIEGTKAVMLANFKHFSEAVFSINVWTKQHLLLSEWIEKLKTFLQQIFSDQNDLSKILVSLDDLATQSELANFSETLSFIVFQKILKDKLQSISGTENFLGHGITFCALVPMRSVPFQVIALMGMNDGEFPRQDKHHSFDLMAIKSRKGDRSRRDEDRYLFLESILATRSQLIISYIGQNVRDNTELPPSVLVNELLESLAIYTGTPPKDWICKHPLQAFSSKYFSDSSGNKNEQKLFSYAREYLSLSKSQEPPSQVFITEKLPELDDSFRQIPATELIKFYKSPARAFLKQRFSIQSFDEDITLPIREPFELESFKDGEVRQLIMDSTDDSEDGQNNNNELIARAKGLLPYGDIGHAIYNQQEQVITQYKAQLPEFEHIDSQYFSLELETDNGSFSLKGELRQLTKSGRVIQQVSKTNFTHYIDLWINHLILNIECTNKTTYFYSPDLSFSLNPIDDAEEKLKQLIGNYWKGLQFPLQFFPKSAFNRFKDKADGTEQNKKAVEAWNGSDFSGSNFSRGEKEKFENWLLHRTMDFNEDSLPEEFTELSNLVFGGLFSCYSEY